MPRTCTRFAVGLPLLASAVLMAAACGAPSPEPEAPTAEAEAPAEDPMAGRAVNDYESIDAFLADRDLIDPGGLPVTFPYEEVLNHVVVDVAFGDDEPVPFMFDTGASTFVSPAIAEAHGGDVMLELRSQAGGGTIITNALRTYPSLTAGGALEISDALALDPWEPHGGLYCVTPHGLFGAMAMTNAVWQIDYGAQEITVAASVNQLDHIEGAIAVPFEEQEGVSKTPFVELGVGTGTLRFIVDTGGGIPLTINTADLAPVGVEVPADAPGAKNYVVGAAGQFEAPIQMIDLPVRFGDTEIVVPVMVGDGMAPTSNGNIGHAFLENFVVTFDWSTDTMYLEPLAEDGTVPPLDDPPGAGLGCADGGVIVSAVTRGGPADEAGLPLGAVVTHVDGESVEGITLDDYCALSIAGNHQSLTTEDGTTYDIAKIEGYYAEGE